MNKYLGKVMSSGTMLVCGFVQYFCIWCYSPNLS